MIFRIPESPVMFPPVELGEEDGLLAIGGTLTSDWLITAYSQGIFPWFAFKWWENPKWYCPMDRFVIFPDEIHISHSMHQLINRREYKVTINADFDSVIRGCSQVDDRVNEEGAWLGPNMIDAYTELYRQGVAMSVEVWRAARENDPEEVYAVGRRLVGGLYGVTLQKCFFGESMFSLVPSASKLALIGLAQFMQANGWKMIDCQYETPHLKSMGGRHITYAEYMHIMYPEMD